LTVLDSDGTKVNDEPVDLKAGESRTFSYLAAPLTSNQPKKISFTYTGKDSFGDELEPENTQVFLINPVFDDSQFSVHLSVEVLTRPTAQNNAAELKFSIDNKSLLPLFDIRIEELHLGEIATVGTLSNGVTELFRWVALDSDRDLEFFIEGKDDSGAGHQLDSVILSREFLLPDATPEPAQTEVATDTDYLPRTNIWGNFIFRILIILGAVMVLSCAVLIALRVLDVGRVEVKDPNDFSNIFDPETEEPTNEQDSRSYNEDFDDIKPIDEQQDVGRDSFVSLSEGLAPKHLELKKQPAKKIRKKTETRRIN